MHIHPLNPQNFELFCVFAQREIMHVDQKSWTEADEVVFDMYNQIKGMLQLGHLPYMTGIAVSLFGGVRSVVAAHVTVRALLGCGDRSGIGSARLRPGYCTVVQ